MQSPNSGTMSNKVSKRKIFIYPHSYLRDRQVDRIKEMCSDENAHLKVLNKDKFIFKIGNQVSAKQSLSEDVAAKKWFQYLPAVNIKVRPKDAPKDAVIYIWGGIVICGPFILDIDNPWALVGYNPFAMRIFKPLIKWKLLSKSCQEIRVMSKACAKSMELLFGREIKPKLTLSYPKMAFKENNLSIRKSHQEVRFLFVGTQFEIKGGEALLRAFSLLYAENNNCSLTLVTHLPERFKKIIDECDGIRFFEARYTREEVHKEFMSQADALVFPTLGESFGLVALEALAHSMYLIASNVYALSELVDEGRNGKIIEPPISVWEDVMPSKYFTSGQNYKFDVRKTSMNEFIEEIYLAMKDFLYNPQLVMERRMASHDKLKQMYREVL